MNFRILQMVQRWWCQIALTPHCAHISLRGSFENKTQKSEWGERKKIPTMHSEESFLRFSQLHTCHYIIATSLFYYINGHCFRFTTSHKTIAPSMPTWDINAFFTRIKTWKFGEKKFKIDKVIQCLLKPCTFYTL